MQSGDFLVIGGGVAGLSAAARLAAHGRTLVLEAEDVPGFHSSGRSATYYHFGIGNRTVRALTAWSRGFFETGDQPLSMPKPALFIARPDMVDALDALEREMRLFTDTIARADERQMLELCPVLRTGDVGAVAGVVDTGGRKLDAAALLQHYIRAVRQGGGALVTGARVGAVVREGGVWTVTTEAGDRYAAPVLVNAAGAWADRIAGLAGVRPLGLQPKRRTIIVVDPPAGAEVGHWPFVKAAVDDFYMIPEAGRLMASPVDEVPSEPGDAQPDEYDVALAAAKVEEYTTLSVTRIPHRWAGLRSFLPDRVPAAGFAPDADGFFWLAGQGGYGLQTAPAMAAVAEAGITGAAWPAGLAELGAAPAAIRPDRLLVSA